MVREKAKAKVNGDKDMVRHYQVTEEDFAIMGKLQQRYQHSRYISTVRFAIQQWIARDSAGRTAVRPATVSRWLARLVKGDAPKPETSPWNARFSPQHIEALDRVKDRFELSSRSEAIRLVIREQAALDGLLS